jgi:cell division protein ZapA (FtsZ GTPase activity inhibitor)
MPQALSALSTPRRLVYGTRPVHDEGATMAATKRRVDVQIMGLPLSVRTERDDAWVHGLANQVNRRIDELRRAAPKATAQQLAVLVALNLAEELQLERERGTALRDDAVAVAAAALQRVGEALAALDSDDNDEADAEAHAVPRAEA